MAQSKFPHFLTTLLFFAPIFIFGQTTIKGVVIDAHSEEPVPFANVYLQSDPSKGVSADFDGIFEITFDSRPDILEASALGYEPLTFNYEGENELTIKLNASSLNLAEVVVTADGEDPAYGIMRNVIKNKPKNNRENFEAYSCEVYNKMEIDLINISEEFKNMKLNNPFRFVFDHIDSTSEDEPFLPLFVSEALSDFYFQKDPKKEKEQIKAIKIVGDSDNESVGQLLGVAKAQLNIYDNWIDLVAKKFAGPVSDNGKSFYRYYLIDSALIDNKWCYQIQYFPKHKGINGFYGDLWVHDSTFAVKKIKLQLLDEGHLNFVEKLSITQEYQAVNDTLWVPKKDYITVTSTTVTEPFLPAVFKKLRDNAPGVQAKRSTTYKGFNFSKEVIKSKVAEDLEMMPDAFKKDDNFWKESRHVELNQSEQTAYFLIDTIKSLPIIDLWEKVTTTAFTGYMWGKNFDIGNFYEFFSRNPQEGFRTKFGLRTSTGIHKKLMVGGYGAYGWDDKKWKYGFDMLYVFNTIPRRAFGVAYLDDYTPNPNFNPYFSLSGDGIGSNYFLRRANIPFKLLDVKNLSANYFHEWESGLSARIELSQQENNPLFNFTYKNTNDVPVQSYISTEASVELRYAYDEVFLSGAYERSSLGSRYPIISAKYEKGIMGLFSGDTDFHSLEMTITDKVRWGAIGYTELRLTAGQIWGTVPYINMFIPIGNEGFIMNFRGFNSVPEYTFAADRFAYVGLDHHFDGAILQLIPLFRKMRLRAVANFRAMLGDMSESNRTANSLNLFDGTTENDAVRIRVPNREPFMETSVGVENIFRFFRFDAIWRLNYPEITGNRFGVRASISFAL